MIEFRDKIRTIPERKLKGADFFTNLCYYFKHRDSIYTESDQIDQIKKEKKRMRIILKAKKKDSNMKNGQVDADVKYL